MGLISCSGPLFDDGPGFKEEFNRIDSSKWTVSSWQAPGAQRNHSGTFSSDNAQIVDGYLQLRLDQTKEGNSYVSSGAEIASKEIFGYGTYEYRMRASTTSPTPNGEGQAVSGSVTSAFIYSENSVTEIDVEFESNENRNSTHFLSWKGENTKQHTTTQLPGPIAHDEFYLYKIIWLEDSITYYRNDVLVAQHVRVVPSTFGSVMFNHWGAHLNWWGGWATPDVTRYAYIDYFRYTPIFTE